MIFEIPSELIASQYNVDLCIDDLEAYDEISGAEKESLQAGTQEGSEGHSDVQMSIQDEIKGDALNEVTEAEKLMTSNIIH